MVESDVEAGFSCKNRVLAQGKRRLANKWSQEKGDRPLGRPISCPTPSPARPPGAASGEKERPGVRGRPVSVGVPTRQVWGPAPPARLMPYARSCDVGRRCLSFWCSRKMAGLAAASHGPRQRVSKPVACGYHD